MDTNDRQAIEQLFGKLRNVENQSQATPRDAEAEAFIQEQVAAQPAAPYYMAQTIVVQEQALETAQARIEELEQRSQPASSGGFLGGLFGGGTDRSGSARPVGSVPRTGGGLGGGLGGGMGGQGMGGYAGRGGGGFLAGAAQTAMGVAGGVLLGSAIAGMLSGDEAQAAETDAGNQDAGAEDVGADEAGFDGGGDMDMGGGDFGL